MCQLVYFYSYGCIYRPRCFRCKKQKPIGEKNYVLDPAVEAAKSGKVIAWQEVVDPATYQMYE